MAEDKNFKELLEKQTESVARTILTNFFDESSFVETRRFLSSEGEGCAVVTGYGYVDGAPVYAFADDPDVKSGGMDKIASSKIRDIYSMAAKNGSPVIGFYNSKGGDVKEGQALMAAYSNIITESAKISGVVPQISVVYGVCGGIRATLCCMADFVIMLKDAELFLTPPFLAEDKLYGAGKAESAAKSGTANIICDGIEDALEKARFLIKILPQNNLELSGNDAYMENTGNITEGIKGLDMIKAVADLESVIPINEGFGTEAVTSFGSINWRTIGFVCADNGRISGAACAKIARFVNICDAFSIPVVTFIDSAGFELSNAAELSGCIRDTAKLAWIYNSATTQKITVITGEAVGAPALALGCFGAGSDICIALENSVISPISPKAAAEFLKTDEAEYKIDKASACSAIREGLIDRIVKTENLRIALTSAIDITSGKRELNPSRKHINIVF